MFVNGVEFKDISKLVNEEGKIILNVRSLHEISKNIDSKIENNIDKIIEEPSLGS